jgi:hypothetical protein
MIDHAAILVHQGGERDDWSRATEKIFIRPPSESRSCSPYCQMYRSSDALVCPSVVMFWPKRSDLLLWLDIVICLKLKYPCISKYMGCLVRMETGQLQSKFEHLRTPSAIDLRRIWSCFAFCAWHFGAHFSVLIER